jgi:hypothetical protein
MANIIPNQQHSSGVLYPTALNNYKEKQFTGSLAKVQLSEVQTPRIARKKVAYLLQFVDALRCFLYDELQRAVSSVG